MLDRDGRGKTRLLQRGDCECNSYICMLLREELSGDLKKNIVSADAETFAVESVESDPSRPCVPFSKACGVGDTCCGHPSFNSRIVCNAVPVEEDRSLCCIPEDKSAVVALTLIYRRSSMAVAVTRHATRSGRGRSAATTLTLAQNF